MIGPRAPPVTSLARVGRSDWQRDRLEARRQGQRDGLEALAVIAFGEAPVSRCRPEVAHCRHGAARGGQPDEQENRPGQPRQDHKRSKNGSTRYALTTSCTAPLPPGVAEQQARPDWTSLRCGCFAHLDGGLLSLPPPEGLPVPLGNPAPPLPLLPPPPPLVPPLPPPLPMVSSPSTEAVCNRSALRNGVNQIL